MKHLFYSYTLTWFFANLISLVEAIPEHARISISDTVNGTRKVFIISDQINWHTKFALNDPQGWLNALQTFYPDHEWQYSTVTEITDYQTWREFDDDELVYSAEYGELFRSEDVRKGIFYLSSGERIWIQSVPQKDWYRLNTA